MNAESVLAIPEPEAIDLEALGEQGTLEAATVKQKKEIFVPRRFPIIAEEVRVPSGAIQKETDTNNFNSTYNFLEDKVVASSGSDEMTIIGMKVHAQVISDCHWIISWANVIAVITVKVVLRGKTCEY